MHVARKPPVAFGIAAAAIGIAGGALAVNPLQGGANLFLSSTMMGSVGSVSQQAAVNQVALNFAGGVAVAPQPDEYMLDGLPRSHGSGVLAYYVEYMLDIGTQWSKGALHDC